MGYEKVLFSVLTAALLAGCGLPPFNSKPVVMRAPEPPQVVQRGSLPLCPRDQIWQAQALSRNMARLRLGISKLQAVTVLGDPAHAETFSLTNGAAVEVLFYHTPETICRVASTSTELMPLVFQDDRLLGYGQSYYKGFIAPMMRPMAVPAPMSGAVGKDNGGGGQGMPAPVVSMTPAAPLPPTYTAGGRRVEEDLPTPPPGNRYQTPVNVGGNGYTGYMQTSVPYEPAATVGRGDPLR